MKKILLGGLFVIGSLGAANAQSFHVHQDTVRAVLAGYAEVHNDIMNMSSSDSIVINWKVISHNFPASWVTAAGICDNYQCYPSTIFGNPGTSTQTTKPIAPMATASFDMQIDVSSLPAGGPYYATVELKQGSTTPITATFELTKFSTGVATINRTTESVTVYPNPAHSELNVLFDGSVVKNIAVYNLIGKAVKVFRVSGNSAKLDIDNLPSGIHFINLIDAQGKVVATRKFTHL